jgi:predicted dehydrogenase
MWSRRHFVRSITASALTASASPAWAYRRILGANERLNIGAIGVGGRGAGDLDAVASENIVAICDVDENALGVAGGRFPMAVKYFDYRQLLERKDLEAVVVGTPDHHHAPPTVRALRRGLHVYCEKPLTHTVEEARIVTQLAREKGVATQMGTQNHEHPGYLRLVELLRTKAIGAVNQVHVITDRPGPWWPQGLALPRDKPAIPTNIKWDLWLGPATPRDYHPAFAPFRWRGWWDYGCGAIGDMAIHLMDPAFWGLRLGGRVQVASEGPVPDPHCGPKWMKTRFQFEQRGELPPVDVFWYEGEANPPASIASELPMNGSLFIGEKGRIAIAHDGFPKLLPQEEFADFVPPEPFLPASPGHHLQWIEAAKGRGKASSSFDYSGPFTEVVLLGNVAYRIGQTIEFDPETMRITNLPEANSLLSKNYRPGWEVV